MTALARSPEATDLSTLVASRRRSTGLACIAETIVARPEFLARHGPETPPDYDYLQALFWAIDGEDPDVADEALLAPPATRASVLLAASQSRRAQRVITLEATLFPDGLLAEDDVAYQLWLAALPKPDGVQVARHAGSLPPTTISAILVVPPARPDLVVETVDSLVGQLWPHWDCVLACPPALPRHVRSALEALARRVPGVMLLDVPDGPWAAHANQATAAATGQMACWLEPGDRLHPHAFYEVAAELALHPAARLLYTDEDRIDGEGTRTAPWLKPGWSPDLALAGDTIGQLAVFDRAATLGEEFRAEDAPHERYGLALRLAHDAPPDDVRHIPVILFHCGRQAGRPARFPQARAVPSNAALSGVVRRHLAAHHSNLTLGWRRHGPAPWPVLDAALPEPAPRVTAIIPLRDKPALIERCLDGLLRHTDYPDLEVVVVDNGSEEGETLELLLRIQHDPRVRVLRSPGPFDWAKLNREGAAAASGGVLLLLNNDVEMKEPRWLHALVSHAMRPDVGVAGARLLFPQGQLQHGGVLLGPDAKAVHALTWGNGADPGYAGQVATQRDLSAVTGACLAIRRDVFDQVGGLADRGFRVGWSDIDLCLRVRQAGYRVLWLPQATLVHHEMATRGADVTAERQTRHETERDVLRRRWSVETDRDPFLSPSLEMAEQALLSRLPRRSPPWRAGHPPEDA